MTASSRHAASLALLLALAASAACAGSSAAPGPAASAQAAVAPEGAPAAPAPAAPAAPAPAAVPAPPPPADAPVPAAAAAAPSGGAGASLPPVSAPTGQRHPGKVVWYDLLTLDPTAAERFYGGVLGWTFAPQGPGYTLVRQQGVPFAGIVRMPVHEGQSPQARWVPLVSVADLDAAVAATRKQGGKVVEGPASLGPRGRYAAIADARGAQLVLLSSPGGDPADGGTPRAGSGRSSGPTTRRARPPSTRASSATRSSRRARGSRRSGPSPRRTGRAPVPPGCPSRGCRPSGSPTPASPT